MSDTLTPEDLDGLPEELLDELRLSSAEQADLKTVEVFRDNGLETFGADRALIVWYRATGEVVNRTAMLTRLSRMAKKGLLVSTGKGVYALPSEPEDDDQE